MSGSDHTYSKEDDDYDDVMLPGFRFHPTDEEIVGFYLRRMVEKIPLSIELIKQVDIYKFDPWDLPRVSILGDKEWYFFCKRGRKYRNSIRPNRVTGSGFWKATGMDKPIYSSSTPGEAAAANYECIGLKKSLVYYCGSAGKGTKTDWMMHEFRLPPSNWNNNSNQPTVTGRNMNIIPEAEVWTLCRILKRNIASNKNRKVTAAATDESSKTCCSLESDITKQHMNLGDISLTQQNQMKPVISCVNEHERDGDQLHVSQQNSVDTKDAQFSSTPSTSFWNLVINGDGQFFIKDGNGDEPRSVVELPIKY